MKKQLSIFGAFSAVAVLTPTAAFAQNLEGVTTFLNTVNTIVNTYLIPIAFSLIVFAFFWGLAKYVFNADNEEAKDQGKRIMIGGVIALTVAALIWGIVNFIGGQLGFDEDNRDVRVPGVERN